MTEFQVTRLVWFLAFVLGIPMLIIGGVAFYELTNINPMAIVAFVVFIWGSWEIADTIARGQSWEPAENDRS